MIEPVEASDGTSRLAGTLAPPGIPASPFRVTGPRRHGILAA
jgi:hypothetical protein